MIRVARFEHGEHEDRRGDGHGQTERAVHADDRGHLGRLLEQGEPEGGETSISRAKRLERAGERADRSGDAHGDDVRECALDIGVAPRGDDERRTEHQQAREQAEHGTRHPFREWSDDGGQREHAELPDADQELVHGEHGERGGSVKPRPRDEQHDRGRFADEHRRGVHHRRRERDDAEHVAWTRFRRAG